MISLIVLLVWERLHEPGVLVKLALFLWLAFMLWLFAWDLLRDPLGP